MTDAERWSGSILGQCLGDALGFVVEGMPPEVCQAYVRTDLMGGRAGARGRHPFSFGQYTDDSQLARTLLESFATCGTFEPAHYAQEIARLFADEMIVGRGRATEAAAKRLIAGAPWERAGTPPPTAGNGSAMRAGPVGLLYGNDFAALFVVARDQGRITHQDPRCSAGAVAVAASVAIALRGGQHSTSAFCDEVARTMRPLDGIFADAVLRLPEWIGLPPDEAADRVLHHNGYPPDTKTGWRGISPFVVPSVLWSLYSFLRSPDDYWTTICTAIGGGGDADTTAAMAGAISGARVGVSALPVSLVERLNDRGRWRAPDLVALGERCRAIVSR